MSDLSTTLNFRGKNVEEMTREELVEALRWAAGRIREMEGANFNERMARTGRGMDEVSDRAHLDGWKRTTFEGTDVEAYYTERWGRGFYVQACFVDMLDDERASMLLQAQLAKMLAIPPV